MRMNTIKLDRDLKGMFAFWHSHICNNTLLSYQKQLSFIQFQQSITKAKHLFNRINFILKINFGSLFV